MTAKRNQPLSQNEKSGDKNSDKKTCCPNCGEPLDNIESAVDEDIFPDDDFICPACCCGIYIEVKEE